MSRCSFSEREAEQKKKRKMEIKGPQTGHISAQYLHDAALTWQKNILVISKDVTH